MIKNDISLLKKIISLYSLSGNEEKLICYLQKKLASVSSTTIDEAGNLICRKGKKANDLAIFVHADKVGFMVSKIKPRVQVVGLSDEVENTIKTGSSYKMIGLSRDGDDECKIKMKKSKVSGKLLLSGSAGRLGVGDFVAYAWDWFENTKTIISTGLDNALGMVAGIKLFEELSSATLVITVQEEMGFHGARKVVETLKPKKAYVIDATYADDPCSSVVSGGGVSFCVKDKYFADKKMLNQLIAIAKTESIKYQLEVIGSGSSDYAGIANGMGIVPYVFIGIPIKNMHSSRETVFKTDFEAAIMFVKALGKKLTGW